MSIKTSDLAKVFGPKSITVHQVRVRRLFEVICLLGLKRKEMRYITIDIQKIFWNIRCYFQQEHWITIQ